MYVSQLIKRLEQCPLGSTVWLQYPDEEGDECVSPVLNVSRDKSDDAVILSCFFD